MAIGPIETRFQKLGPKRGQRRNIAITGMYILISIQYI